MVRRAAHVKADDLPPPSSFGRKKCLACHQLERSTNGLKMLLLYYYTTIPPYLEADDPSAAQRFWEEEVLGVPPGGAVD